MKNLLTVFALSLCCFVVACGGDDKKPGGNDAGTDDGSVQLMDGEVAPDSGPLDCKGAIQCTTPGQCGVLGYACQAQIDFTIGGADDPIGDDPQGEGASYPGSYFEGGYCTKNAIRPTDDQFSCAQQGCDSCSQCLNLGGVVMCMQNCKPSLTTNDCPGENSCVAQSATEGFCFAADCKVDDECHIKRVDTNNNGKVDPYDATDNPGGDRLQYFDGTGEGDIAGFTASCDEVLHTCHHSGTADAEAGDECFNDFECEADGTCSDGICTKFGCDLPGGTCAGNGQCVDGACVKGCVVGEATGDDPLAGHPTCGEGNACVPAAEAKGEFDGACTPGNFNDVTDNNVGEPCIVDTDCFSPYGFGRCSVLTTADAATGSVCTIDHCMDLESGICGTGNACLQNGDDSLCVKTCANGADCSAGTECVQVGDTTNACITGGCTSTAACGAGVCSGTANAPGICEQTCTSATDCSDNRACVNQGGGIKQCTLECATDSECKTGTGCDSRYLGQTQAGALVRVGACKATCTENGDCAGDDICAPGNVGGTANVCTPYCSAAGQCPAGKSCDTLNPALKLGVCADECTTAADCAAGEACRESTTGDGKACSPGCSVAGDCRDGETCDKASGQTLGTCS